MEPSIIVAGDSVIWTRSLSDYPAPDWTLTYTLLNRDGVITIPSVADGADHLVSLTPAQTGQYRAGRYDWTASVTDGTDRYTIDTGTIQIQPDPAAQTSYDTRSHARVMLDAIEAHLQGKATAEQLDVLRVALNGRDIQRNPELLIPLRDRYRGEVAREELAARAGAEEQSGFIQVRFT